MMSRSRNMWDGYKVSIVFMILVGIECGRDSGKEASWIVCQRGRRGEEVVSVM